VLAAFAQILLFQLAGEALVQALVLPMPGPVLGMALLFLRLRLLPAAPALAGTAQNLLSHLSLLFVPAGAGVMLHTARLGDEWLAIAVALVASTAIGLAVTALVLKALTRHRP
jgi:holin-like protein